MKINPGTYSLFILKPGFLNKEQLLLDLLKANKIAVMFKKTAVLPRHKVESHYAEHLGKPFYEGLVKYMSEGQVGEIIKFEPQCLSLVVASTIPNETEAEFIARSRRVVKEVLRPALKFKKSTFPKMSDEDFEEMTKTANGVHASDSPESAYKEIANIFPSYFSQLNKGL